MPARPILAAAASLLLTLAACSREEPTPPPAAPTPTPPAADATPGDEATPSPVVATPTAPHITPEDRIVDADREAPIRARAAELSAIRPEAVPHLKLGDAVVVLVRADPHSGPVYGSGPYTLDSRVRTAAAHAGLLAGGELGLVRLRVLHHDGDHPSVPQNGVTPHKWGPYPASYTIERINN